MKFPVFVHSDNFDSTYGEGRKKVIQTSLIVFDHSEGSRMVTPIEIQMSDVLALEFKGKCEGEVLELTLIEPAQQMFGGRMRAQKFVLERRVRKE